MEKERTASKRIKKYSWIVGLLIFLTALLFGWVNVMKIEKGKKTTASYTAQSTVRRINAQLDQYVELSEFLGNVILAGYDLDQTTFSELAEMFPNEAGVIKTFELAPNGIVTDICPQQGNEKAFGMNLLTEHERKEDGYRLIAHHLSYAHTQPAEESGLRHALYHYHHTGYKYDRFPVYAAGHRSFRTR